MRVTVKVDGAVEVMRDLERMGEGGIRAGKRVVGSFIRRVARRAKPLTPVDPEDGGELRETVRSTGVSVARRSGRISGSVVAGGKRLAAKVGEKRARIYPTVQHEDVTLRHTTGQAKFIEIPFMAEVVKVPGELRRELDREWL